MYTSEERQFPGTSASIEACYHLELGYVPMPPLVPDPNDRWSSWYIVAAVPDTDGSCRSCAIGAAVSDGDDRTRMVGRLIYRFDGFRQHGYSNNLSSYYGTTWRVDQ